MDRDRDAHATAETSPTDQFENLADNVLDEKIRRTKNLLGYRLPNCSTDGGTKLKIFLQKLLTEKERRMQSKMGQAESCVPTAFQNFEKFERTDINSDYLAKEYEGESEYSTPPCNTFTRIRSHSLGTHAKRSRIDECFSMEKGSAQRQNKNSRSFGSLNFLGQENACRHIAGNRESLSLTKQGQTKKKVAKLIVLDEDEDKQPTQPHSDRICERWTKDRKIYYPVRDDPDSVEISYFDMKCLNPNSYLSSQIMNFYIRYLQRHESLTSQQRNAYHFFNTYFYNKLESLSDQRQQKNCDSLVKLRRWLKGVNIFEKAYVFLPINYCLHWSLAIICFPAKEERSGPLVLHLDSLDVHSSSIIFQNVGSFLKMEWEYSSQTGLPIHTPIEESIWKTLASKIVNRKIEVPQQGNSYDCGLFVLYFIERFLKEFPPRIRKNDLNRFGRKWFRPDEASLLRESIRGLLMKQFDDEISRLHVTAND